MIITNHNVKGRFKKNYHPSFALSIIPDSLASSFTSSCGPSVVSSSSSSSSSSFLLPCFYLLLLPLLFPLLLPRSLHHHTPSTDGQKVLFSGFKDTNKVYSLAAKASLEAMVKGVRTAKSLAPPCLENG